MITKTFVLSIVLINLIGCASSNIVSSRIEGDTFTTRRLDLLIAFQNDKQLTINLWRMDIGNLKSEEFKNYDTSTKNENAEFFNSIKNKTDIEDKVFYSKKFKIYPINSDDVYFTLNVDIKKHYSKE